MLNYMWAANIKASLKFRNLTGSLNCIPFLTLNYAAQPLWFVIILIWGSQQCYYILSKWKAHRNSAALHTIGLLYFSKLSLGDKEWKKKIGNRLGFLLFANNKIWLVQQEKRLGEQNKISIKNVISLNSGNKWLICMITQTPPPHKEKILN